MISNIKSFISGKLIGHLFTISELTVNENDQHLISLSTARVWIPEIFNIYKRKGPTIVFMEQPLTNLIVSFLILSIVFHIGLQNLGCSNAHMFTGGVFI